jgi:hypothetical protein
MARVIFLLTVYTLAVFNHNQCKMIKELNFFYIKSLLLVVTLNSLIHTSWHLIIEGGKASRYHDSEFFLEINQSETRIVCGGHVCLPIEMK